MIQLIKASAERAELTGSSEVALALREVEAKEFSTGGVRVRGFSVIIEHLVGPQHLKRFASLSQGADGVRGLKGNKGEKVRNPQNSRPQIPEAETFFF